MAMPPSEMPSDELDRRIGLLDKKIRKYEKRRKEQLGKFFKGLTVMLLVIALICAVIYLLVGNPYLTEDNTVTVTGRCVSIELHRKYGRVGVASNTFVLDDGNRYRASRRHLKAATAEMEDAMIGEEITIRIMPDSKEVVALWDETRVYLSLDKTNRDHKVDFVTAYSMTGVLSALVVLLFLRLCFPMQEVSDVRRSRKERDALLAEKESRNRQE